MYANIVCLCVAQYRFALYRIPIQCDLYSECCRLYTTYGKEVLCHSRTAGHSLVGRQLTERTGRGTSILKTKAHHGFRKTKSRNFSTGGAVYSQILESSILEKKKDTYVSNTVDAVSRTDKSLGCLRKRMLTKNIELKQQKKN